MKLSTDLILNKAVEIATTHVNEASSREVAHLDIGSGTGALIESLRVLNPNIRSSACDYTQSLMALPGQKVDVANLNTDGLPYPAEAFDLVTCTEVIEHLENYRKLVRDVFRVVKPGGLVIFTTPNVLSLQSRVRNLFFGFANLFGPLPVARQETFSTTGHITPISYFYLAHALAESGFRDISLAIDKPQRSALPKLLIFWPLIALFGSLAKGREVRKYKTVDASNEYVVDAMNSLPMLLGRTIVVSAKKP
ncbi:MAG: class I SAM-dependent methyltransferase [Rhodocyclaceae bacterium]|nr:class I SAM-dependent methyltransferase [Rhodocyclaceae bacterium]